MDFLSLAKKRYACRQYLDRKVEDEKLAAILEAGRIAPTGANYQPQRLIVIESKEGMERLARCTRDFGAPLAIIVCADTSAAWTRKYDGKMIGDIDASIVTDHMMLEATAQGLDTLWVCMFKPEAVRAEFGLPDEVYPDHRLRSRRSRLARAPRHDAQAPLRNGLLRKLRQKTLIRRQRPKTEAPVLAKRIGAFITGNNGTCHSSVFPAAAASRSMSARLRLDVTR